jgi:hypothetical protein
MGVEVSLPTEITIQGVSRPLTWQHGELGHLARVHFTNHYGVSIAFGTGFVSNGVDTYEVAVIWGTERTWHVTFGTPITTGTLGGLQWEHVANVASLVEAIPASNVINVADWERSQRSGEEGDVEWY